MRSQPFSLYLLNFFLALHTYLVAYVASGFIADIAGIESVNIVYAAQALLGFCTLIVLPRAIRALGNARVLLWLTVLEAAIFGGIVFFDAPSLVLPLIVFSIASSTFFPLCIDILIEHYTRDEGISGGARTAHLTVSNSALVLSPFIAGAVVETLGFRAVYIISMLALVPFFFILIRHYRAFQDPEYKDSNIPLALKRLCTSRDLTTISILRFLLNFFFAWMVVYVPLFLHETVGFSWGDIGLMLSIALIPYVLTELPAGLIADARLGEQELLISGFLIAAVGTVGLSFTSVSSFAFFATALVVTRLGAALVESMTETYFFRRVKENDEGIIMVFRLLFPVAYLLGALSGAFTLFFLPIAHIWTILAILLVVGAFISTRIRDTQ